MTAHIETLTQIPPERWPSLVDIYKEPIGITARAAIKNQIIIKAKYPDFPVRLYAPYNNPEEGIIFIWNWSDSGFEISIYSIQNDQSKLIKALKNSKEIDWTLHWDICAIIPEVQGSIVELLNHLGHKKQIFHPTYIAYISQEKALQFNTDPYPNTRLEIIGPEYANDVDQAWPSRYPGSLEYFQQVLKLGTSLAIFGEPEGDIRGWVLRSVRGDLHALHVKPEHRRKGYAQLLVKALSKNNARHNIEAFGCIVTDNKPSAALFTKIGFELIKTVQWIDNSTE